MGTAEITLELDPACKSEILNTYLMKRIQS